MAIPEDVLLHLVSDVLKNVFDKELDDDCRKAIKDTVLMSNTLSQNIYRDRAPADLSDDFAESTQDSSLVNLSCRKLTQNTEFLKTTLASIPVNLYPALMKEAVRQENRESAAFLMSTWPSTIISISEVVPGVVDSSRITYLEYYTFDYRVKAAVGLTLLIELFLDGKRNDSLQVLRVLDLRGLHLSELVVGKLVKEIVCFSEDVSENYHVMVDCEIISTEIATMLTELLNAHQDTPEVKGHLHFYRLDVSNLDETVCWELMKCVDPSELVRLCLPPISSPEFCNFILTKFSSLTALDISLAKLQLLESEDETLPFHLIPNLKEFTLRGAQSDLSAIIPTSTLQNLQFLDIRNCRPEYKIEVDLRYLTSVPLQLRELSLRGFKVLQPDLNLWRNLLRSLAPTLNALDLFSSFDNDINFDYMVIYMLPLVNLRYLKLNLNELSMKTMMENATRLTALPQLRMIALPFKFNPLQAMNGGNLNMDPDMLACKVISKRFATEKSPPAIVKWMFELAM